MMLAGSFIQFPGMSAKWVIGSLALFHTAVASLAIGFAFVVTVLQIIGYRRKDPGLDLLAKRVQLFHVCIYNIGTINAIGLVFVLSGLYPQFWSQIFVNFFWPMIIEEVCFFLLATTLTLHYFFWDYLAGHKKLHIFLGSLLTPLFLIQFYVINGMAGFMLTPGAAEGSVSQWGGSVGILGWDKMAFYNPSFLMLTFHRALANISYGAFVIAGLCGLGLFRTRRPKLVSYYKTGAHTSFQIAFFALLALPIVGFFYAWVLKYHAKVAYENLMWGKGDVSAGGIDWWWLKHVIVISMISMCLVFFRRAAKDNKDSAVPIALVYAIGLFYVLYYAGMGMQMTWYFFWMMLLSGVIAGLVAHHLLSDARHAGRALFVLMGILSFATVMLGGYVREAARPRFVSKTGQFVPGGNENRFSHYDDVYRKEERQKGMAIRMVLERPKDVPPPIGERPKPGIPTAADLYSERCSGCHTLARVHKYRKSDWPRVVKRMLAYGTKLSDAEADEVIRYLREGRPPEASKDRPTDER